MEVIQMNQGQFLIAIVFFLSIFILSILILRRKALTGKYLGGLILGLVVFVPRSKENSYDFYFNLLIYSIYFAFYILILFQKEFRPRISEKTLIQLLLILLYALGINEYIDARVILGILILLIIPIISIGVSSSKELRKSFKIYSYVWFLLASIILFLFQTNTINLQALFFNVTPDTPFARYAKTFLAGLIIFPILGNIIHLLETASIVNRKTRTAREKAKIEDIIAITIEKYDNYQVRVGEVFKIILFQGGFLAINYFFEIIDPILAIGISLFFVELVVYGKFDYWRVINLNLGNIFGRKI